MPGEAPGGVWRAHGIRTETDRGIIVLIDDRFTHARYRHLFPSHWQGYQVVQDTRELKDKLTRFWSPA